MWAAEELLAHWLDARAGALRTALPGATVVELGAGSVGLAALAAHAGGWPAHVVATDGNPAAARALRANVASAVGGSCALLPAGRSAGEQSLERSAKGSEVGCEGASRASAGGRVDVRELRWDRSEAAPAVLARCGCAPCHLLLCADCLFFEAFHADLLHTVRALLSPEGGVAVMLAPQRGGSLDRFVDLARDEFVHVRVIRRYDEAIWEKHVQLSASAATAAGAEARPADPPPADETYEPDVHYPLMVLLGDDAAAVARMEALSGAAGRRA